MKIPYFEAKLKNKEKTVRGFYFEYPCTTYCFTSDYNKGVELISCIVDYSMTDWGLPNMPRIHKIDKSTLTQIGYIDTDNNLYKPPNSNYVKKETS